VLRDAQASLDLTVAMGVKLVRVMFTGVRVDSVKAQPSIADEAIVGTYFKKHGGTWNAVGVR
jgi:predicted TIM-barrel enzyme